MTAVGLITSPGARVTEMRRALRRLGIHQVPDADSADAIIVMGNASRSKEQLQDWVHKGKRLLCTPDVPSPPGAAVASYLRFLPGALQIRNFLRGGGLGRDPQVTAQFSAIGTDWSIDMNCWDRNIAGGGVLIQYGTEILDLIGWWLGPLTVVSAEDDSVGGVEAEFLGLYRIGTGSASIQLSRLRRMTNLLEVSGTDGRIVVDLSQHSVALHGSASGIRLDQNGQCSLVELHEKRIRTWFRSRDNFEAHFEDAGARDAVLSSYRQKSRLRHPWEVRESRPFPSLQGRKVLVTGGAGFIGARLTERLLESGADITVTVRSPHRAARVARLGVKLVAADLTLPEATLAVVEQHEIVFNLAHDFAARTDDNVRSLELLANACRRSGVARLVQVSSIAVYDGWPRTDLNEGSPATMTGHPYKKAKLRIEGALRTLGKSGEFTTVILQPTIVYGPFSKLWTDDIADRMAATPAIIPSESLGLCNGVYVDDVVDALLAAATAPVAPGESFIISGPAPFPWRELFESYARALNQSLVLEKSSPASISGSPAKFHQRFKAYVIRHARSFIATEVSPAARRLLGNRRFEDLMAKVRIAVISRQGIYRPASSNPALYYSRAQCSIEKARRLLVPPGISAHEGLELTASYLRWRQGASARR